MESRTAASKKEQNTNPKAYVTPVETRRKSWELNELHESRPKSAKGMVGMMLVLAGATKPRVNDPVVRLLVDCGNVVVSMGGARCDGSSTGTGGFTGARVCC